MDCYRVASSRGDASSTMQLLRHFDYEEDKKNAVKYIRMASNTHIDWDDWFRCMQLSIRYGFECTQFMQPLTESTQSEHALKESICHFLGLGVPKRKALDALQAVNSDSYSVIFEPEYLYSFWISDFYYRRYWVGLDVTENLEENLKATGIRDYADFLFKSNQFLPMLLLSYKIQIYSSRKWKCCALHAPRNHCLDAHFLLANYYSNRDHPKEHEMKRHLRISADAGHSHAQYVNYLVFGKEASVSKGVKLEEERRDRNEDKEGPQPRKQHLERNVEKARD